MGRATGSEIVVAAKRAAVWGTAVECGAGDGLLILPGVPSKSRPNQVDDSLGLYFSQGADPGEITVAGDINAYLRYAGLDLLLAQAIGAVTSVTATTPADTGTATGGTTLTLVDSSKSWTPDEHIGKWVIVKTGTAAGVVRKITDNDATSLTWEGAATAPVASDTYDITGDIVTRVLDPANNNEGHFLTWALYNQVNVEEIAGLKVTGFKLSGEVGKPVQVTFSVIGNDKITGSAINTSVTIANVTVFETIHRVLMEHAKFRINTQAGDALDDDDRVYPSAFELSFQRKMSGVYGVGSSYNQVDEPSNDGIPDVTLKLTFPRYTAATHFTNWDANTPMKLDLTFTGALLGGTSYRTVKLELPHLRYAGVDAPVEAGIMKHPVDFAVLGASTAPAGMTGITKPLRLTVTNQYGGDPLQAGN